MILYSNGQVIVTTTVPDTITSWVASAFAVSNIAGLGVSPETAKVNYPVFKVLHTFTQIYTNV